MGKFYISAPVDDVMLARATRDQVAALQGRLPSTPELKAVADQHGLDFATMLLYQAMLASPLHGPFIAALDSEPVCTTYPPIAAKVLVIPALFHAHYPETGADAAFAAGIARQCGFQVDTIGTGSLATSTANAALIKAALERETAADIWIFAVSKGSADFRAFLQLYPDCPAIARIRGWINVCGISAGSQIADYDTATGWRALKYRAICRLFGTRYQLMRELRTDHPYWRAALVLPPHMQMFSFAALPLGAHIQKSLIGRYQALGPLGPNDGMMLCRDAIADHGPAYPVWGADHFFRSPQVISLLYRFFGHLRRHAGSTQGGST
jgi:hypothetical protein